MKFYKFEDLHRYPIYITEEKMNNLFLIGVTEVSGVQGTLLQFSFGSVVSEVFLIDDISVVMSRIQNKNTIPIESEIVSFSSEGCINFYDLSPSSKEEDETLRLVQQSFDQSGKPL